MNSLFFRLLSLGCVTADIVIWAIDPRSIDVVAAWICASVLVCLMVGLILESRMRA